MNLKNKTVLLYDTGNFISWAEKLKEYFGRVLLFVPSDRAFPVSNEARIGDGIEGVERVCSLTGERVGVGFWDVIDEVDLFVFLDVGFGDIQAHLRGIGKRVWGSGHGDDLELFRWPTKCLLNKLGLPVQPCRKIVGIDDLRAYLKKNKDKWIKLSGTRGDQESFHHEEMDLTEPILRQMEYKLGDVMKVMEFVVEDPITPAVEIGYDGLTIDGEFPDKAICGIEVKDEGYIGAVMNYSDFPKQVHAVNDKLSSVFKGYKYRNFFSTEIRVPKSLEPYLIDLTCRSGSPPSEVMQEMVSNWGDIFWYGADGILVQPEYKAKFGAQAIIYSQWAETNVQAIHFPDSIKDYVKLKNYCVIEGRTSILPQSVGLCEIGSVVAIGSTIVDAVKACNEKADQVKGYGLKIKLDSLPKAIEEFDKAKDMGVEFKNLKLPTSDEINSALS
jgi:hypothetical protein